jgi:hypothetical protein
MKEIGNAGRQEAGRRLNNRAENSHQPFRRRERALQRFWAPGLPQLVHDRLVSDGGWVEHKGVIVLAADPSNEEWKEKAEAAAKAAAEEAKAAEVQSPPP